MDSAILLIVIITVYELHSTHLLPLVVMFYLFSKWMISIDSNGSEPSSHNKLKFYLCKDLVL